MFSSDIPILKKKHINNEDDEEPRSFEIKIGELFLLLRINSD